MRVPPDQSGTTCATIWNATSGSRWRSWRVMLESRVPNRNTLHALAVVGDRVQEVQQDLRVAGHGAGDVAQHHERRRPRPPAERASSGSRRPAAGSRGWCGARSMRGPSGSGRSRRVAAEVERQHEAADFCLGARDLGGAHASKSMRLQPFLLADGERRVERGRLVFGGCAACAGRRALRPRGRRRRGASGGFALPASSTAIAPACRAAAGSRQNRAKAWSNTSACSCRCTIVARSAARASRGCRDRPVPGRAMAAIDSAGPTGRPARRSSRAKCITLAPSAAASTRPAEWWRAFRIRSPVQNLFRRAALPHMSGRGPSDLLTPRLVCGDQQRAASRASDAWRCRPGISAARPSVSSTCPASARAGSGGQRAAQSIVSATPGSLNRSSPRRRCTNATTCAESVRAGPGALAARIARSRAASG